MVTRTWLHIACLLIAGCATSPQRASLAPVAVISTEPMLAHSARLDPAFVASRNRLAAAYDQEIAGVTEHFLDAVRLPGEGRCDVVLVLLPGGYILRVEPGQCSFSPPALKAVSDALVSKSLPYKGYESVFMRTTHMALCSPRAACRESAGGAE